ncbi:DUF2750 domain-containing protein [Mangrovihabitans endophyticus]|uniref:DUF2750 domain-containing protein n=1 Tax=Mangrovihabitans endophyticus TaxID=1751298 RepID=A0A8J3FPV2_9ACTN|nr:DUF2750 domain-containing protein [Mangrovihabitans endophyticus]GGL02189.1 hypothetical protein GCM10012284_40890 [Mangrovihabitans endophyticus]
MSLSGPHRAAFRREATQDWRVFSIRDQLGHPTPKAPDGTRALPFWSRASRAHRVVDQVGPYRNFEVVEVDMDDWLDAWLPDMDVRGLLVGVNWAGARATGYDMSPARVASWFSVPM